MATKVMIIRHAEKPNDDEMIRGVSEDGDHDPNELSVRGWQRAGALVRFFAPSNPSFAHLNLAIPDVIFACGADDHAKSVRSEHTVLPLSRFLNKAIDLTHHKGDEKSLVQSAIDAQGVVLISWEHKVIPGIANSILGNTTTCPEKWPDSRFDLVWVFDLQPGSTWTFTQIPQMLLPGDRSQIV